MFKWATTPSTKVHWHSSTSHSSNTTYLWNFWNKSLSLLCASKILRAFFIDFVLSIIVLVKPLLKFTLHLFLSVVKNYFALVSGVAMIITM